jgi:hypothetical protein
LNNAKVANTVTQKKELTIAKKTIIKDNSAVSKSIKINAPNTAKNISISSNKLPSSVDKNNTQPAVNSIIETDTDEVIFEKETIPTTTDAQNSIRNQPINLPWVLVGRENKLVKQVIINSPSISIDLYDNGTIDNDTIMIFDNKVLLLENKRLSYKATHFDVNFNKDNNRHEIIIVAHNLGTVPPNTALMVVKDGTSRQEIYITSTLSVNAMIIFEQKKPSQ